ncbi:hypothetical protein WMW72_27250 [Paenibacillus filicis]|uniref:Uncharacterized protein n=1 Tax=Paenibacillus filicis TaxID=669464 RepID=A0ABU9DSC5_9BACL
MIHLDYQNLPNAIISRENISKWLTFPEKTNQVENSLMFIEKSLRRLSENNGYWAGIWHKGRMEINSNIFCGGFI